MEDHNHPGWARELRAAIALHDLARAGARMLGPGDGADERLEHTRQGVVGALDRAAAAGVSEAELDAELAAVRREALSTMAVLRAVAEVGGDRERLARRRGHDPSEEHGAWTSTGELAERLGVAWRDVRPLIDHALDTGLLSHVTETATTDPWTRYEAIGLALTPAGERCVQAGDLRAQPRSRPADAHWPELGADPDGEDE